MNTTHLSVKKTVIALIVGLLSSFVVFSQTPTMEWSVNVENLRVGTVGSITITGENISDSAIRIDTIYLPKFNGIDVLQSPPPEIKINGVDYSGNVATNKFSPYESILPNSFIILKYYVVATCEAIYDAGDSLHRLYDGEILYGNGKKEELKSINSFSVSYPILEIINTSIVIGESNQADVIFKIVNRSQDASANNILLNVYFPDNAKPNPGDMHASLSTDGDSWVPYLVWPEHNIESPSSYNISEYVLHNIGVNSLRYGDTLYVKFRTQIAPTFISGTIRGDVFFADSPNTYRICSDKKTTGGILIVRQLENPIVDIFSSEINDISICDETGIIRYVIRNSGNGTAYLERINFRLSNCEIIGITSPQQQIYEYTDDNYLTFPTYKMNDNFVFADINNDNLYAEIPAHDSVILFVTYKLTEKFNTTGNVSISLRLRYANYKGETKNISNIIRDRMTGMVQVSDNVIDKGSNQTLVSIVSNYTNSAYDLLREKVFFLCASTQDATKNVCIEGNSPDLRMDFDFKTIECGDNVPIQYTFGYKQPTFCAEDSVIVESDVCYLKVINSQNQIDTTYSNIVVTGFNTRKLHYGYKLEDVLQIVPYKGEFDNLPKQDESGSLMNNVFLENDTIELIVSGDLFFHDFTEKAIKVSLNNLNESFFFISGFCIVGMDTLNITQSSGDNSYITELEYPQNKTIQNFSFHLIYTMKNLSDAQKELVLSAYCSVMDDGNWNENTCSLKETTVTLLRFQSISEYYVTNDCGVNISFRKNSGNYVTDYIIDKGLVGITILKDDDFFLLEDDINVLLNNQTRINYSFIETSNSYKIIFDNPLYLDFKYYYLIIQIQKYNYRCYKANENSLTLKLIFDDSSSETMSVLRSKPHIEIEGDVVALRPVGSKEVVFENLVLKNLTKMKSDYNYLRWSSESLSLKKIRLLYSDGNDTIIENTDNLSQFIFNIPLQEKETIYMTFFAEIQNCSLYDTLHATLDAVISCQQINISDYDSLKMDCYTKNIEYVIDNLSVLPTITSEEFQYKNLCDTMNYSFSISNTGTDISRISFWLDEMPDNIVIKYVEAGIGASKTSLADYTTIGNNNISTEILQNSTSSDMANEVTHVNVGLSVECDPTKNHIDITKPIIAHVLRYDVCNNPKLDNISIKPKIKGFENMDSIQIATTTVTFDNQGIGTVSVSLQNNDLRLIDSVDFTAILPEGLEYVENSTTPNYFSSIRNDGPSVVWAFERNKFVDSNENLQFTFQVRNVNRCERRNDTLKMAISLERTLHGSCGLDCLVKKTSDTVQLEMQQTPVPLLESFSVDKQTICAGDELTTTIVTNGDNVSTTISANPTEGIVIDNNRITVESSVNGIINLVVLANDGQCKDSDTLTVEVLSKEQATILSSTEQVLVGNSLELMATPANGVWLSEYVDENGVFKSEKSGVYTVYYEIDNGVCNSKDSIEIPVYSCEKDLFIEPDSLKVSEQAYQIIVPISLSPVAQCGICSDLTTLKFNVIFNDEYLEYDRIELQQILQETVDIYNRVDKNTIVIQMYSDAINGFVMDSINLLKIYFNVKQPTNTSISISEGYYNGELSSEILREDSIQIYYMPKLTVTMNDTLFCAGGQVELVPIVDNPSNGELRYVWNTRQSTPTITVSRAGDYVVTVYDSFGSYDSKHVVVSEAPAIVAELADTAFCEGMSVTLQPVITQGEISQYEWNTGENTAAVSVSSAGTYTVTMTDIYGCTSAVSANVTVNENSEIPVFTYNRNNMDSYTATISTAVENNVYMWHGSEGVTFDSNQSPSVTISVASYPAAICVESQDENGCTSVSHCDTIPLTPPISISGNRVLCKNDIFVNWLTQQFHIESPNLGSNYVWSLSNNTMATIRTIDNGVEIQPYAGVQGDVDLIVQEFRNGELVNEGRETLQIRVRPQSGDLAIYGPNDWTSLCPYEPNVQYSIPRQGNFIWSVPEDAQITSGQGTNSITITFGREGGDIFAREQNGEGCFAYTALHTWVGTHSANCGSLKSFTIEDVESQPNEIQLEQYTEELNVAIYPVPVENVLNIVANANIENVIIYTSSGSEVKTVAKQNQIDVSSLLSGDYFVRIVTDKGVVTKSIIVVK